MTLFPAPLWLRPTRRAIDWTPVTVVSAAAVVTLLILGWRSTETPEVIGYMTVGALAAAAVMALADTAKPLLEALPTSPLTRLAHRSVVTSVATGAAATVLLLTYRALALDPAVEPELGGALLGLVATGIAVHSVLEPATEHSAEAAAAAVLMWVGAGFVPTELVPEIVGSAWLTHPWAVTALANAVILGTKSRQ